VDNKIASVLAALERQALAESTEQTKLRREEMMQPITHETGLFYNVLTISTKARRILEIGTSVGYSTLWFADGLRHNYGTRGASNTIITVESNPSKVISAKSNFRRAGTTNMIKILEGKALSQLKNLKKNSQGNEIDDDNRLFDIVFLDADKENLIEYFDLVLPLVRIGGIIAADNVLYPEEYRSLMTNYLEHIRGMKNMRSVTVPIGNGEEISLKLGN
jgi:predicted O-methyltransferase YrrM